MFCKRMVGVAGFMFLAVTSCNSSSIPRRILLTLKYNARKGTVASGVAYSADGKLIAAFYQENPSYSEDSRTPPLANSKKFDVRRVIKMWDSQTGKELMSINKGNITESIFFFPNNRSFAGTDGNSVKTWDTMTGKEKLAFKGHDDVVHDLDISRDGKWLATGSSDGTVKLWDARTGACLHTLKAHPRGVWYVSFSPDGTHVADTGWDRDPKGVIRIWDWASEKQVLSIPHDFRIGKALFSPDGKHLACYRTGVYKETKPGQVEVWDISSGELVFRRDTPSEEVNCIAYSRDGAFLASGEENSRIVLRDAITGDEVLNLVLPGYERQNHNPVTSIAFSPVGDCMVTSFSNGTVCIWDVKDVKKQ